MIEVQFFWYARNGKGGEGCGKGGVGQYLSFRVASLGGAKTINMVNQRSNIQQQIERIDQKIEKFYDENKLSLPPVVCFVYSPGLLSFVTQVWDSAMRDAFLIRLNVELLWLSQVM